MLLSRLYDCTDVLTALRAAVGIYSDMAEKAFVSDRGDAVRSQITHLLHLRPSPPIKIRPLPAAGRSGRHPHDPGWRGAGTVARVFSLCLRCRAALCTDWAMWQPRDPIQLEQHRISEDGTRSARFKSTVKVSFISICGDRLALFIRVVTTTPSPFYWPAAMRKLLCRE